MINSPIKDYLHTIYERYKKNKEGNVADYIPELATGDPDRFGLVLATADGEIYKYGDTTDEFTIQSMSKPFTYGLALDDNGKDFVDSKIDVEASGDAFNEISLDADNHRPKNAMINAGAITATSLVKAGNVEKRYERIRKLYSDFAGRDLKRNDEVYESELATGDRNRAIAWMLKNFGIIEENPEEILKAYFSQCSTMVNAEDIAFMAATLANNGINPKTGKEIMSPSVVERVLSVMLTAGMYDGAGDWITSVGIPAKSGVGGGIIGVLPGQLAIAVFSPRLDVHGNSARGISAFEAINKDLNLHIMHVARNASSALKSTYDLTERSSLRRRTDVERQALERLGSKAHVFELQGDILFPGAEVIMRESVKLSKGTEVFIYDNTNVDSVTEGRNDDIVRTMMYRVGQEIIDQNGQVGIVDPNNKYKNDPDAPSALKVFKTTQAALEWAENSLLSRYSSCTVDTDIAVPIEDFEFFGPFTKDQKKEFISLLTEKNFKDGELIRSKGESFGGIYFIVDGVVNATVDDPSAEGGKRRFATVIPGMSVGELALATGNLQETDLWTESNTKIMHLTADKLDEMSTKDPTLAATTWKAMTIDAYKIFNTTIKQLLSATTNYTGI